MNSYDIVFRFKDKESNFDNLRATIHGYSFEDAINKFKKQKEEEGLTVFFIIPYANIIRSVELYDLD